MFKMTTASSVFQQQLKELCLDDFPTGFGTWRADCTLLNSIKKSKRKDCKPKPDSHFGITLKDGDATTDKTETLAEFLVDKKSPWLLNSEWSKEAKLLRQISIKTPLLVDEPFIKNHFQTLRIVDKNVSDVDPDISQLSNLSELTLTANYLESVCSKNLPHSLKVLELCANNISDLQPLLSDPPPLEHLGLGMNQLKSISDYITGLHWPHLHSLDLSDNYLSDLVDVISGVSTLPKLRYLLLKGNPLALLPSYRGFVIDSIKELLILDDLRITADERFNFKGLAKRPELIRAEVTVELKVDFIRHLPVPDEIKCPADFPDLPIVVRKYLIQFWYPGERDQGPQAVLTLDEDSVRHLQDDVIAEETDEDDYNNTLRPPQTPIDETDMTLNLIRAVTDIRDGPTGIAFIPVRSSSLPFAPEGLQLNWTLLLTRGNITTVRDFFRLGMDLELIEEKMNMYPPGSLPVVEEPPKSPVSKAGKKSEKASRKGSKDPAAAAPPSQGKTPGTADKKPGTVGGGKKGKKLDEADLLMHSKETAIMARWHLDTSCLLEDHPRIEIVLTSTGPLLPTPAATPVPGGKDKKLTKQNTDRSMKPQDKGKSTLSDKGDKSSKKSTKQDLDEDAPPVPTEVGLGIRLIQWTSAKDARPLAAPPDTHIEAEGHS